MTVVELKERLEQLKQECDGILKEKNVFTELVYSYVDKNRFLSDDYTEAAVALECNMHFFVEDGEESLPTSLEVELDANGDIKAETEKNLDEYASVINKVSHLIANSDDPVEFVKAEIERTKSEAKGALEKTTKSVNNLLIAALSVGIVVIAWIIYLIARG